MPVIEFRVRMARSVDLTGRTAQRVLGFDVTTLRSLELRVCTRAA